ncbi:Peptidase S1 domain-containing protein [Pseudomonas sp. IT-P44]
MGLDATVCIVLRPPGRLRDKQKRYRFTPPVGNWRIPDALSVDALCGFGAKNFNRCTEFIQHDC